MEKISWYRPHSEVEPKALRRLTDFELIQGTMLSVQESTMGGSLNRMRLTTRVTMVRKQLGLVRCLVSIRKNQTISSMYITISAIDFLSIRKGWHRQHAML